MMAVAQKEGELLSGEIGSFLVWSLTEELHGAFESPV
jgi:hypothetical protein